MEKELLQLEKEAKKKARLHKKRIALIQKYLDTKEEYEVDPICNLVFINQQDKNGEREFVFQRCMEPSVTMKYIHDSLGADTEGGEEFREFPFCQKHSPLVDKLLQTGLIENRILLEIGKVSAVELDDSDNETKIFLTETYWMEYLPTVENIPKWTNEKGQEETSIYYNRKTAKPEVNKIPDTEDYEKLPITVYESDIELTETGSIINCCNAVNAYSKVRCHKNRIGSDYCGEHSEMEKIMLEYEVNPTDVTNTRWRFHETENGLYKYI